MAVDFHVVGRVGKDHRGVFLAHQRRERQSIEGAAAQQPIATEEPGIADLADQRPSRGFGQNIGRVGILGRLVLE